ncbi:unnamed protein product [Mytilus coruscus]|uniref:CCHC-type domain-containing protein n=1 Tax=Mytilus coruscus TaxID=42192 RepID=A0A6J8B2J7_MYTCO|nr:unnamed protein product [Mytilus coruscus]
MDSAENKFETSRLTAQGRPVLPRSRSCEIFHDLTPTGEIGIRVNQDQWPSQEKTNRYEKDGIHHADNRPLSGDLSPSRKLNEPNFERDYDINLQNTKYYKKKPALYDGESNWEDYLVQFELIAAINKWSDIEKALELATSLRGTAQSILTDLRPEMRTNFIQLTAALASRFQPENQAEMYRAQMKSKIRGRTEQIPVLGQDIKRLVRLAYPSAPIEIKEQLACDCFIDSLNDVDMGWAIFQAKAKSINNAIQVALEYEAFQNDRRKHDTKLVCAVNENNNFDLNREIYLSEQVDDISGRLGKIENNEKNQKTFSCYHCGVSGHLKRECPL